MDINAVFGAAQGNEKALSNWVRHLAALLEHCTGTKTLALCDVINHVSRHVMHNLFSSTWYPDHVVRYLFWLCVTWRVTLRVTWWITCHSSAWHERYCVKPREKIMTTSWFGESNEILNQINKSQFLTEYFQAPDLVKAILYLVIKGPH
jgi:hypothetical protein